MLVAAYNGSPSASSSGVSCGELIATRSLTSSANSGNVLPAVYVAWLSTTASTYGQPARFVGLDNYAHLAADPIFWRAFWNTFFVVNGIVYVELALGLGLAVLLTGPMPFKAAIVAVILAPYAITESSGIVMWRYMLEPDVGLVTQWMEHAGLPTLEWSTNPVATLFLASVIAVSFQLTPGFAGPTGAGTVHVPALQTLPR